MHFYSNGRSCGKTRLQLRSYTKEYANDYFVDENIIDWVVFRRSRKSFAPVGRNCAGHRDGSIDRRQRQIRPSVGQRLHPDSRIRWQRAQEVVQMIRCVFQLRFSAFLLTRRMDHVSCAFLLISAWKLYHFEGFHINLSNPSRCKWSVHAVISSL